MAFKVFPFIARVRMGATATEAAASQLADLINQEEAEGWRYVRMENVEIHAHDLGETGCYGLGCWGNRPSSTSTYRFDMVVFEKQTVPEALPMGSGRELAGSR